MPPQPSRSRLGFFFPHVYTLYTIFSNSLHYFSLTSCTFFSNYPHRALYLSTPHFYIFLYLSIPFFSNSLHYFSLTTSFSL